MGSFTSAGVAVSNWSANSVNRILPNTADTECVCVKLGAVSRRGSRSLPGSSFSAGAPLSLPTTPLKDCQQVKMVTAQPCGAAVGGCIKGCTPWDS